MCSVTPGALVTKACNWLLPPTYLVVHKLAALFHRSLSISKTAPHRVVSATSRASSPPLYGLRGRGRPTPPYPLSSPSPSSSSTGPRSRSSCMLPDDAPPPSRSPALTCAPSATGPRGSLRHVTMILSAWPSLSLSRLALFIEWICLIEIFTRLFSHSCN